MPRLTCAQSRAGCFDQVRGCGPGVLFLAPWPWILILVCPLLLAGAQALTPFIQELLINCGSLKRVALNRPLSGVCARPVQTGAPLRTAPIARHAEVFGKGPEWVIHISWEC